MSNDQSEIQNLKSKIVWVVAAGVLDGLLAVTWGYTWRVPFLPEALGTAWVALRWGPGAALLAAAVAGGVEALFVGPARLAFLPARLLVALTLGYGARAGWAGRGRRLLMLSLGQGAGAGVVAGLVQAFAFHGFSGEPRADLLTALASRALPPMGAALAAGLLSGVPAALVNNLLAFRFLPALWKRGWGRALVGLASLGLGALLMLGLPVRTAKWPGLPDPLALPALATPPSDAATPTTAQLHLTAGEKDEAACIACHGDRRDETSLQPGVAPPHAVHLNSPLLNFRCTDCHLAVDLAQEAGAGLRRQVDVGLCAACHRALAHTAQVISAGQACTTCHTDWRERMAGVGFVDLEAITPDACLGCHGGRAWYGETTTDR